MVGGIWESERGVRQGGRAVRAAALMAACLWGSAAWGQLQGHISMVKDEYLAGEPMYVLFEMTNVGKEAVQFAAASDPYIEVCSGYQIEVTRGGAGQQASCAVEKAGEDCVTENEMLAPGESRHRLILVNYAHDVSKMGSYEIHAVEAFKYGVGAETLNAMEGKEFRVEARIPIRVIKGESESLKSIYQVYVRNLQSQDDEIQREAERAIVSGAPPWLEDTIVAMVGRYTSRELALLGLRNLNTARSREELGKIVQNSSELTQENEMAVKYLAQLGDKKYFPMLLELAKKVSANEGREYVLAAAKLGGDDAVPFLRELLSSADANARANGLVGLEKTGSRAAVPLLIEALKDPNADLGKLALSGLTGLTHRSVEGAKNDPPAEEYGAWSKWWAANGETAEVYGPRECGEIEVMK